MKILAIDTATEACSVALCNGDLQWNLFDVCPQQHAQRILPMVEQVLCSAGLQLTDLDGLAFGQGPGSFTGVRIATSMIQGFALATSLPVVGISTLATLAQAEISKHSAPLVNVAIDARMNEVYFATFSARYGLACLQGEEQVLSPALALSQLSTQNASFAGTGWQAYPELATQVASSPPQFLYPNAVDMLPLARQKLQQGEGTPASAVEPSYVRNTVTWKKLPGR